MYLSKLELHGFKSFAGRTDLHFDPGITAVVGPNGCGKSNIVDAVRWVIGEQRARVLRSEKMENVIFNGTSKRRPLGMAEVKLTIENTRGVLPVEYSEVTIGRRLYRSGESEYLLNGVQCRLKDITDLFMDTGMGAGAYSVIELKMVEEILSENAHDRRRLFEEAAGITKYKLRRTQTIKKLDSTQADLTRLRDLVEEIDKRVRSLKRQANKAARYRELEEELHRLEIVLAYLEYVRLQQQKSSLDDEIQNLHDDLEGQNAEQTGLEAELESRRTMQLRKEERLVEREGALQKHVDEVRRLEADIRLVGQRLQTHERDHERSEREQSDASRKTVELSNLVATLQTQLDASQPELQRRLDKLELAQKERDRAREHADAVRESLQDARTREQELAETLSGQHRQHDRLQSRCELLDQDSETTSGQLASLRLSTGQIEAEFEEAEETVAKIREAAEASQAELAEAERTQSGLERELEEAVTVLRQIERQREAALAETQLLAGLVSSYEDFSEAIQFLAEESSQSGKELRTVADVLACDERDRSALDAALGNMASCIVVDSDKDAAGAMTRLRQEEKGRATFLILSRLQTIGNGTATSTNGVQPLSKLVRTDKNYAGLTSILLGNALVTDTIEEAQDLARTLDAGYRIYARSGEWVDVRGLLHGGSNHVGTSAPPSRLGRREQLEAARERLGEYDRELESCSKMVDDLRTRLSSVDLAEKRALVSTREQKTAEAEKALARIEFRRSSIEDRQREMKDRLTSIAAARTGAEQEIEDLNKTVRVTAKSLEESRSQRVDLETEFQEAETKSRSALTVYSEVNLLAVEKKNEVDNLERDLDRTRSTIEELEDRVARLSGELILLADKIAEDTERKTNLEKTLADVKTRRPELEASVSQAKDEVMETRAAISSLEARLRNIRQSREQQMREENARAVRLAEIQTRMEDLLLHVEEDFGVALRSAEVEVPEGLSEVDARERVRGLRERVRSMGPVNALALQEYEEEKERLDFLSTQLADLEQAEKTLLETIDEINTTASRRFEETFAGIRSNFSDLFSELFGGEATADVVLENPSDPLESPIEVFARPRGKRPSVLAQLSGGEKTLTAIALLFAIYLVKPSPFCILDEVDAPLDDANITRFMHLIRKFADSTQFIMVTHNKRTMEAADRMYGITMQEQGVSNLVGVRFEEALEPA